MISKVKEKIVLNGYSCYLFSSQNIIRKKLSLLVRSPKFDNFILALIITTNILLGIYNMNYFFIAFDDPLSDPDSSFNKNLDLINTYATIIFFLECLFKVIVKGFIINGKDSYL